MSQVSEHEYATLPDFRPQGGDAARADWYIKVLQVAIRVLFKLLFHVRVRGLENLPGGQAIICPNHLSWADPFLVLLFFPIEPRIYVLSDHHAVGRTGFRAAAMNLLQVVVTVDPHKPTQPLRSMEDVLRRGGSLLIFPEGVPPAGAREGELRSLYRGAAHLSVLMGVPIVPVGISGTSVLWLRRRLHMNVGKPISPEGLEGSRRERSQALLGRLERTLARLIPGRPAREKPRVKLLRRWLTNLFA